MLKKKLRYHCIILLLVIINACNDVVIYKAGNRVTLDYVIETKLSFNVIRNYIDTMVQKQGYDVPQKWAQYYKLIDLDSIDSKRIYFKDNPEEMYLVQLNGVLLLSDVYNENIVKGDWVATSERMPKKEADRVKKRFKEEVLDKIETMAKKNGVPDSIIYFKPKW